jgi:hypothetical protein
MRTAGTWKSGKFIAFQFSSYKLAVSGIPHTGAMKALREAGRNRPSQNQAASSREPDLRSGGGPRKKHREERGGAK